MMKHVVVSVPHHLGVDEIRRRLDGRVGWARQALHKGGIHLATTAWAGEELGFSAEMLGQTLKGQITAAADSLRFELKLPWALAVFSSKIEAELARYSTRLVAA
jgi:hypothetical protein